MKLKTLFTLLLLLVAGVQAVAITTESDVAEFINASIAVNAGTQITAEDQLVSGQLYLVYYVGNGDSGYMKDTGSVYNGKNDNNATQNAVYRFVSNNDGTWKVQNYVTGKYWGTPTANANSYIGSNTPGAWTLNFQSNNYVAPSCNGHSWNRSGTNIHPWSSGTGNVNQLKIMEVSPATDIQGVFDDKDISVSSEAVASLQTNQWYVMFDRGANHGYLYENGENKLYNTATVPTGSATDNAKYLVRIVGWNNEYYIQTGRGNFFGKIQGSTTVPTTTTATEQITIKKIDNTDGHFYLMSADGIVLDANDLTQGDGTVVGWGNTVPTATGGNNDWAFYSVEFVDSWIPAISEIYTINNTNTNRGAMMYNGTSSYVWSSGKSGTFSTTDPNCQWVLVPSGTAKQYYLYNVGAGKFAVPSGTNSKASWVFSNDAVAVTLIHQSDGTYKIKTVATDTYAAVSNGFNGPIINYNDIGGNFTITKVEGDQSLAATAALNKLIKNQTALTAAPTGEGWYAIRVKSGTYANEFVYAPENEIAYASGRNYPLTFMNAVNKQPAIDNTYYLTYIAKTSNGYAWQLPNGLHLSKNASNYFPTSTANVVEDVSITYNANGMQFIHGGYKAVPYYLGSKYFVGETSSTGGFFEVYPVNLTDAGLVAWRVIVNGASASTKLTCLRSDVNGLTAVYNNGYFFLPTGVTPTSEEFSLTGMLSCAIDADAKTITVEYNPELSLLATDVIVKQGNQTTGQGNIMQALLRIKATPFSDFQPTQLSINLTGAANVDNVKVYSTATDQIRATNAAPVLLGTVDSPSEGVVNIPVASTSISAGTTLYYWVTADIKSNATEWGTIDASLASISYTNAYKQTNTLDDTTLDLASIGNPNGEMRIYKQQSELWTASMGNSQYYRIPTIIQTADGGILALTDDRHNSSQDLGNHKIDVVARKSVDNGLTWGDEITVAVGDGSSDAAYGYGDPAVVRTKSGKLICLMAAGKASYASGQLHMGYSESSDNGATWSAPIDIYSSIEKNGIAFQSVFTSAGKGVTFSNGRVAFAMNGKVNGTTNEYIIYSDDEGQSWTLSTTAVFTGADESKLEIMNDNSLLVTVRRGGFNSIANRGYNFTTGDASGAGINDWGTQGNWGNEMNANGCNADILYYNRDTEDASRPDVIFHTLTKNYSTFRKDLRLYMSFDQGKTWTEAFQLQPGYAAYSSMQKLSNGDLAIIFEDGSIGNEDKQDCYAINYVVISSELINAKIDELHESAFTHTATIISQGETNSSAPWGTWSPTSGWANTFTTNASSGCAGVAVSATYNAFNRQGDYDQRVFLIKPSAAGASDEITITAPDGYFIDGYTIGGYFGTSSETYTLTAEDGSSVTINKNKSQQNPPAYLTTNGLNAKSTKIVMSNSNSTNNNYAFITHFLVRVIPVTTYTRDITSGRWGTICVPGAVATGDISGAEIYRIAGKIVDGEGMPTELKLEQVDNMEAGKPYLFLPVENSEQLSLMYYGKTAVSMPRSENGLVGSFTGMDVAEGNYLLSNNTIVLCGTDCLIGANRAYINMSEVSVYEGPSAGVKGIMIFIDGEDPDGINVPTLNRNGGEVYDLAGRRVQGARSKGQENTMFNVQCSMFNGLKKGIYIVNGKKVVF